MRNVLDKVPDEARSPLKPYLEAIRDAPDYATGRQIAQRVLAEFATATPRP